MSWCIVLLGAELAFVYQLPGKGRFLKARGGLWVPRLDVALKVLLIVARRFETGQPAPSVSLVVGEAGLHPGQADGIVSRLIEDGLLTWIQEDPPCLVPAKAPDRTSVAELIHRVGRLGAGDDGSNGTGQALAVALERAYAERTWADLALEEVS